MASRYSLTGLSARGLRVMLARNASSHTVLRELWHTPPPHAPGDTWMQGQLLYNEPRPHQVQAFKRVLPLDADI